MCDVSVLNVNSTTLELFVNSQKVVIKLPEITVNEETGNFSYFLIFFLFFVHLYIADWFFEKFIKKEINQEEAAPEINTSQAPFATFTLDNESYVLYKFEDDVDDHDDDDAEIKGNDDEIGSAHI